MWILLSPETLVVPDQIKIKPAPNRQQPSSQSGDSKKARPIGRPTQTFYVEIRRTRLEVRGEDRIGTTHRAFARDVG